jgi:lipopolysaccharide export system permease protein
MNRILDRYLARQILVATLTAVVILTLVFGLGNVFKRALPELVDDSLSIERFGQFVLYILPFAVAYTVPWGFLSAVLLTFGRLSADNELVSMRMSGRSMWRICLPVFVLAAVLSGLCFWLNLNVSPRAKWEMKRIVKDVLSDDPSLAYRQKGLFDDMVIHVDPDDNGNGKNVRLVRVDEFNRPLGWVFADRLEIERDGNRLMADLQEPKWEFRQLVPLKEGASAMDALATFPMPIGEEEDLPQVDRPQSGNFPIGLELPTSRRKPNELTMDQIHEALRDTTLDREDAAEYRTELTKRYSISLACVAFCFIGIPLGVTAQRRETSIGFALSLGVAVAYFFFIFLGETFGEEESLLPHILMWAPSVLFIGLGAFLFRRMNKR